MKIGKWTQEDSDFLRANYAQFSNRVLAEQLDRTVKSVKHRAKRLALKKPKRECLFFDNWMQESAYVTGFFAADGTIAFRSPKDVRIDISQKERNILDKIHTVVDMGTMHHSKSVDMHHYYLNSAKVYNWLCELFGQDVRNKSKTIKWPIGIPNEHLRHFVRGVFDGDGSFCKYPRGSWYAGIASGSEAFAAGLRENIISETGIPIGMSHNKLDVYLVQTSGVRAACLADWLYRDCTIALDRKRNIAEEMMQFGGRTRKCYITQAMWEMFPETLSSCTIS